MKQELTKLLQKYKDYCDDNNKKILSKKNVAYPVTKPFDLNGFLEWLKDKDNN